jgi:hypothetical protein
MERGTTAIMTLAFAIGLATISAHAQGMRGMGGGHKHQKQTDKADPQKSKADDKAYSAAVALPLLMTLRYSARALA